MYTPVLKDILHIQPVELSQWFYLLCISLIILAVMEGYKLVIQYKIQHHE